MRMLSITDSNITKSLPLAAYVVHNPSGRPVNAAAAAYQVLRGLQGNHHAGRADAVHIIHIWHN